MQSLGDTLRTIRSRLESSTSLTTTSTTSSENEEVCQTCQGRRFVRHVVDVYHPDAGKAFPCPTCVLGQRENRDWFVSLEAEHKKRGNMKALDAAKDMALKPSGWLVITGPVGKGNTELAKAILSHWSGKERYPRTVAEMLDRWRSQITTPEFEGIFRADADANLVVLDDLGAEKITDWTADRMMQFLDWRWIRRQPTMITTNCDKDNLSRQFEEKGQTDTGERIADRVFDVKTGRVRVVTLKGSSFRTGR